MGLIYQYFCNSGPQLSKVSRTKLTIDPSEIICTNNLGFIKVFWMFFRANKLQEQSQLFILCAEMKAYICNLFCDFIFALILILFIFVAKKLKPYSEICVFFIVLFRHHSITSHSQTSSGLLLSYAWSTYSVFIDLFTAPVLLTSEKC